MFYVEEDIIPAVNAATNLFGNSGRVLMGEDVLHSVYIATREFGKIWYGDVSTRDYESKLKVLSERLRAPVYLFNSTNEHNYTDAPVYDNTIRETTE